MARIAQWMDQVVSAPGDEDLGRRILGEVRELCAGHPAPGLALS